MTDRTMSAACDALLDADHMPTTSEHDLSDRIHGIAYDPPAGALLTTVDAAALPQTVIVDIDGTVAKHALPDGTLLMGHHEYRLVSWELPHAPVIAAVLALRDAGYRIVFCSGRPERDTMGFDVRAATSGWLRRHLGEWTAAAPLLMRAEGDRRPDDVVKRELFNAHIRDVHDVLLALDDRDRVVAVWRSLGIVCLQVGVGDF
jgi:hypothetical protein